jgi:glycosyltransferase involved in cell wall biosynthesis
MRSPRAKPGSGDQIGEGEPRAKKMTVVIIGTRGYPSYYGGFETAVRHLAPYLAEQGWDVSVYGRPKAVSESGVDLDKRIERIQTRGLETKSLSTLTYGLTAVLDAVRRKPDVALVMNVANGYWLPLLRLRGIPSLVNVDGIEWDRAKWGRFAKFVFHTGARMTARFGTRMVYDAKEIARRWQDEFGLDGVFIPYGSTAATPSPTPLSLTRRGYVLVVARFVPENTIPEFFAAVRSLALRWPIVVVGSEGYDGDLDGEAAELAGTFENVTWLGHVRDDDLLSSLWENAGAYFHGHSVGGTNPALVQAMASGAPVVARDTPYNREVLEDAGHFTMPDARSITEAIDHVMMNRDLMERLSVAGTTRAKEHYTWQAICESYDRALRGLVRAKSRRGM